MERFFHLCFSEGIPEVMKYLSGAHLRLTVMCAMWQAEGVVGMEEFVPQFPCVLCVGTEWRVLPCPAVVPTVWACSWHSQVTPGCPHCCQLGC